LRCADAACPCPADRLPGAGSNKRIEMVFHRGTGLPFRISRDHRGVASDAANSLSTM
jgi:hypothetical protein